MNLIGWMNKLSCVSHGFSLDGLVYVCVSGEWWQWMMASGACLLDMPLRVWGRSGVGNGEGL